MTLPEAINFIVRQLETIARVSVSTIRSSVFSVKINNLPKSQEIKGTVTVGNQKNLEKEIKAVGKKLDGFSDAVKGIKPSEVIFPEEMLVTVKNPQKETKIVNLIELERGLTAILKAIKEVKLNPTIQVPKIDLPTPTVTIPEAETLISDDPSKYIPVRLSDGEKFYEALSHVIGGMKRPQMIANIDPLGVYQIADTDDGGSTKYYGFTDKDESWYILRELNNTFRYAVGSGGYAAAWTSRADHAYKYFHEVF